MHITFQKEFPETAKKTNYLNYQRLGFWATVTEINSQSNSCTVLTSNRELIRNIPVATAEWISDDSAQRNLPPKGSFVFVLMPDNCISNAFILCSGYPKGEVSLQHLYAQSESEKKEKNNERETITPGHWNEKEDYSSGTRTITAPDEKIEIKAELSDKESKSLVIKAFDTEITIDEDALTIKSFDNEITFDDDGAKIKTSKDIKIETDGDMKLKANSFNFNDGAMEISK